MIAGILAHQTTDARQFRPSRGRSLFPELGFHRDGRPDDAQLGATPAAATIGPIVHVFDPAAYAVSLLVIIAACLVAASIPATRAALFNPTQALRQE